MRLRTIPEAFNELRKEDPGTSFTMSGLRRLVRTGAIPVVIIGNKRLVDLDALPEQLLSVPIHVPEPVRLGVRPIDMR